MTFEQIKNSKALVWTVAVHIILLILFLTLKYTLPAQTPVEDLIMEVNLGTGTEGSGDDQPEDPEDPAPPDNAIDAGTIATTKDVNTKEVMTTKNSDAPEVVSKPSSNKKKPVKPSPDATKKSTSTTNANTTTKAQQQKAKYTYPGATGKGGNSAANNHPGSSEGNGNGNGDMGVPGGTPGAKNYAGISYRLGNRKMIARPDPKADFNEGGKVVVNVTVNREGKIVSYRILSAKNAVIRKLAEQKIKSVRFNPSTNAPVEQFGDVTFDFKKSAH